MSRYMSNGWSRVTDRIQHVISRAAQALTIGHRSESSPRLFLDITELARNDAGSGIQRVVRNVVLQLVRSDLSCAVEPVYRDGDRYRHARQYLKRALQHEAPAIDSVADFRRGDIFLGLDLDITLSRGAADHLREAKLRGVAVGFVIYDLLPLSNPEWFDAGLAVAFQNWLQLVTETSDFALCISQATASAFKKESASVSGLNRPIILDSFYLGSDLDRVASPMREVRLSHADETPTTFLQVGTIEPRKGHAQVIEAFEQLWSTGSQFRLVIVGRPGWKMDAFVAKLRNHPECGKRLIWMENASDTELQAAYANATAALVASHGEGFGLPIVEAARFNKFIVARNLEVFREIAGGGAYFFDADCGQELAAALLDWDIKYRAGVAPSSESIPTWTWQQSAIELFEKARVAAGSVAARR